MSFHDNYGGVLLGAGISRGGFTFGLGGGYVATALSYSDGSNAAQDAGVGFVYGRYAAGPLRLGVMGAYGAAVKWTARGLCRARASERRRGSRLRAHSPLPMHGQCDQRGTSCR